MTNNQLAKLALSVLSILFCVGFYSGYTATPMTGVITFGSFISIIIQVWCIIRLWKSTD
jgi:hypothetical protein